MAEANNIPTLLGEALLGAIRQAVREEISALNGHQDIPGRSSKAKIQVKDGLLTPEEVAGKLGISRSSVCRLIMERQLPAICLRSGKRKRIFRIRKNALEDWIKKRESQRDTRARNVSINVD